MKYELHITNTAERDMLSIVDYIDFVLLNPSAADALFQEADKKINELADNPEIYALLDDPILKKVGTSLCFCEELHGLLYGLRSRPHSVHHSFPIWKARLDQYSPHFSPNPARSW